MIAGVKSKAQHHPSSRCLCRRPFLGGAEEVAFYGHLVRWDSQSSPSRKTPRHGPAWLVRHLQVDEGSHAVLDSLRSKKLLLLLLLRVRRARPAEHLGQDPPISSGGPAHVEGRIDFRLPRSAGQAAIPGCFVRCMKQTRVHSNKRPSLGRLARWRIGV